jgi:hypothetical protein
MTAHGLWGTHGEAGLGHELGAGFKEDRGFRCMLVDDASNDFERGLSDVAIEECVAWGDGE